MLQPAVETKNASFAPDKPVQPKKQTQGKQEKGSRRPHDSRRLNVVNLDLLAAGASGTALLLRAFAVAILVELEAVVAIALGAAKIRLVDLGGLGKLTVGLERSGLVGVVLEDDVALLVLVGTERKQDNITDIYPDLLSELALGGGQIRNRLGEKEKEKKRKGGRGGVFWGGDEGGGNRTRICANLLVPSKHWASRRPLPNILSTWAYSNAELE